MNIQNSGEISQKLHDERKYQVTTKKEKDKKSKKSREIKKRLTKEIPWAYLREIWGDPNLAERSWSTLSTSPFSKLGAREVQPPTLTPSNSAVLEGTEEGLKTNFFLASSLSFYFLLPFSFFLYFFFILYFSSFLFLSFSFSLPLSDGL